MRFRRRLRLFIAGLAIAAAGSTCPLRAGANDQAVQSLIDKGEYQEAEKLLSAEIKDAKAPITSEPAIRLEVLRRTRQDFSLSEADVLRQLRRTISDVKPEDLAGWREAGDLQFRMIDGEVRYFRSAVSNLFRFSADARERRKPGSFKPEKKTFDMTAHVRELVRQAEHSSSDVVFPVRHRISYSLTVNPNHPRVKPGAVVRCWLPYPQEYRQQQNIKLLASSPTDGTIADKEAPQRTIYFEQTIGAAAEPPKFSVEFQYDTAAYCPKLDPKLVQPYDTSSLVYRENTAERAPHVVFTPEVKRIVRKVVGAETNPLEKSRRIFRWVSKNLPWCSEMEYGIIPNISAKGLKARRGDCGVAGMTFITLCRAVGVPARWQSGWQERPGDWNMHDWSEIYVLPWGWLPADASYGVRDDPDPRVRDFFCGHIDPYRLVVNLDYGRTLQPPKTSFRSEPNDFQRGEIEIDGHNLYFNEWDWKFAVETTPLKAPAAAAEVSSAAGGN